MNLEEILANLEVVGIPTRTNFRGTTLREVALISDGKKWGEFSPFSDYSVARDALWLNSAIESVEQPFPVALRTHILVNATLPAVPVKEVEEVLSWFPGSDTVKIKVGTADDLARISQVLSIIPSARLRLDANGIFTKTEAENFILEIYNKYRDQIEYIEQPCTLMIENEALKSPIPIAIDENLRLGESLELINRVADFIIVKVSPLGGISRALEVISRAEKPVVISSALETSIGISAGIALAAHIPAEMICGLGTVALLSADLLANPLLPLDGMVEVRSVQPEAELIAELRLDSRRVEWWRNRIEKAYQVLAVGQVER